MNASYIKKCRGYEVRIDGYKDHTRPLYLRSVKNGNMKLYSDYALAKHYNLKTAIKHVENINNGLYK